ncbi:MAG: PEP-CTERM sorting domain-containing protein [Limisphaerales bacterium]
MRSHIMSGAVIACAAGATALLPTVGKGQIAYDGATDPTYGSGWSAGQDGGTGFGAWSFDGTGGGSGQEMSSAGAIGPAWTLYNTSSSSGISDVGRSIDEGGGLQVGQTFETVLQNPSVSAGYYTYRGWDIMFADSATNAPGGDNTAAIRAQVFNYYNSAQNWAINDSTYTAHSKPTSMTGPTTAADGVRIDLTLTSATTYQLTMTPLNGAPAYTLDSTYSGPINYINYRLYNTASSGPGDVTDNFGISYMEIEVVPEPASMALLGMGLGGLLFARRKK